MADVRHRLITEGEKHDPKGFTTAGNYTELIRDENGISRYKKTLVLEEALNFVDGNAVPPTTVAGDIYVIIDEGNGAVNADWDGASYNEWLRFNGTEWVAVAPTEGVICYDATANYYKFYNGTSWGRFIPISENISTTDLTWSDNRTQDLNGNELAFTGGLNKFEKVELTATDRGLLINRVTTAQMNLISSPTTNELVYNTDLDGLYRYDGANWVGLSSGYGIVSINNSSGTPTFYATLKAAVDAIGGNGVVNIHSDLLIDDVSEQSAIGVNDTLTINGNGYTITHTCNTGDDFNLITGTTSASLYFNNIKILSNGTAGGNGIAVLFGDSFNFIQCDKLTIIEALNNDIAESTVIKGGNLTATNRYVLFGNSNSVVENANVITKFGRSNFKNCNITINSGGSIGLSAGEISGCTITCDSISSVPFNELSNNCKFWNNTITCTSGTNRVIDVENAGTSKHVNIQGNKIYNYGSGDAIYFQDLKTVVNNYIYSESGHCINFARVANKDNYYNLIDNTCITNATNKAAVRGSVTLTAFQNLSSLRLTAVNINASNTQPAIDISIAINKELELHDTKAIVANDAVDNVILSGAGTAYLYGLKMSKVGTGLDNTATLGNTTGSIDEYGNGQMA